MNKDQKLIAEAYDQIQFTKRKKPFLEKPGRLNPTADLEQIADFLNQNEVYSGAPVKGSGGWYVHEGAVYNDDAEGGHYLAIKIVPEKRGLIVQYHYNDKDKQHKTLFSWPVEVRHLNQQFSKEVYK